MLLLALAILSAAAAMPADGQDALNPILNRVAEEAEAFQQNIPKTVTQETLEQRSVLPPSRFRPRLGAAASDDPPVRQRVREVVSEYSVAALRDSESHNLVEFRQVISVDNKKVRSEESARRALSLGMKSPDDRLRKRMLEEFSKFGLVDIATDYGLILLAFSKRAQENVEFEVAGTNQMGTDAVTVLAWKQKTAAGGELEFHGRQAAHRPLSGTLWVRQSDALPVRIQAWAESVDAAQHTIRDEGTVDYVRSSHGFLTPVSVDHRHVVDGDVMTENHYRYEPFKLFSSDAEIKFSELPDPGSFYSPAARQEEMTIVYLHGFASGPSSSKARFFRERLERAGAQVLIPDLAEGDFEHLTISGQLAVLEHAANGRPVSLMGSSMGGYLAALYAARHAEVTRLVLLAPAFGFARRWPARLGPNAVDEWRDRGSMEFFHYADNRMRTLSYGLLKDAAQYEDFPDFHQPALIFHGKSDDIVPVELSRQFAAAHGNTKLEILESGHELLNVLEHMARAAVPFLTNGD